MKISPGARDQTEAGLVSLGTILDRLSAITPLDKRENIRRSLIERENELRALAARFKKIAQHPGEVSDADGWDDVLASTCQKISVAYFNLMDDPQQALRLIAQARELAHDSLLLQSLERDRRHIQRTILCWEADASLRTGDFNAADYKLAVALANSTQEQEGEVRAMQARSRWMRMLGGVDTSRRDPALYTLAGTGAVLRGKRDQDRETQSYVAQHWLTFSSLPIFPLGAYRITESDNGGCCIHGKVPLSSLLQKIRWATSAILLAAVLAAVATFLRRPMGIRKAALPMSRVSGKITPVAQLPLALKVESEGLTRKAIARPPVGSGAALEKRKSVLAAEGADLARQKGYLASVAASYQRENVPQSGRSLYDRLLADYNSRADMHRKKLLALQADFAAAQATPAPSGSSVPCTPSP